MCSNEAKKDTMTLQPEYLYRTPDTDFTVCGAGDGCPVALTADAIPDANGVTRLAVRWTNTGSAALRCQFEICVQTDFAFTHYLIPAVLYNGNGWGKGKEPKGLRHECSPWIFDHRRTAIPACTISENKDRFFALFASAKDVSSLDASCSMIALADGTMLHRLLYPGIEQPLTYRERDQYAAPHEAFLTLAPGESFCTEAYCMSGTPRRENFAAATVEDAALDLISGRFLPKYTPEQVQALCCAFARELLVGSADQRHFAIGKNPDDSDGFRFRNDCEFGWCGQNGMYAVLFLRRGFATNDRFLLDTGEQVLDLWASRTGKTGLPYIGYDDTPEGMVPYSVVADTCNLSYVVLEYAKAYRMMKKHGIDKPGWLAAAKTTADFLVKRFDTQYGFGKTWNIETGERADTNGTIGAFMIPALCELFAATNDTVYLDAAKTACRFYCRRDLNGFLCTAGALDTYCIDKETSGPLLAGALALYEIERTGEWLDCAKMAGWYFCSWMFHHDTVPVPGSDFAVYGWRTLGGTAVSAQHHHLDPWGALVVPHLLKLWHYTGDPHWKKRADLIWANAIQNLTPAEGRCVHGHRRFAGAQNEGYYHCCWGGENAPGEINDWLVAWPQAFIWNTADFLAEHPVDDDGAAFADAVS